MIARLLFILIPLALLLFGVSLVIGAVNFWIATTGNPQTMEAIAYVSTNKDLNVKVFYPEVLKTTDKDLPIEIEVNDSQNNPSSVDELQVSIMDTCDYLRLDKTLHTFDLTSNIASQSVDSIITSRNNTPPASCGFDVKVFDKKSEFGSTHFDIYINSWVGHLSAFGEIVFGLVIALGSLRGALAVLGI